MGCGSSTRVAVNTDLPPGPSSNGGTRATSVAAASTTPGGGRDRSADFEGARSPRSGVGTESAGTGGSGRKSLIVHPHPLLIDKNGMFPPSRRLRLLPSCRRRRTLCSAPCLRDMFPGYLTQGSAYVHEGDVDADVMSRYSAIEATAKRRFRFAPPPKEIDGFRTGVKPSVAVELYKKARTMSRHAAAAAGATPERPGGNTTRRGSVMKTPEMVAVELGVPSLPLCPVSILQPTMQRAQVRACFRCSCWKFFVAIAVFSFLGLG